MRLFGTVDTDMKLMVVAVLSSTLAGVIAGELHAPCYNCALYNLLHHVRSVQKRQASECSFPCTCAHRDLHCKAGVNMVKDGCDCCFMCARQQGDLCSYMEKCDEAKGLYCDKESGHPRICRAKSAKPCTVDSKVYKDGERFSLRGNCSQLCTCQNEHYACTSICPQEERTPSKIHCPDPQLVAIPGRCCKEWVCPHSHSRLGPEVDNHGDLTTLQRHCKKETIPWTPCSVTCGMGVSVRVTHDKDCEPLRQRRLCLVRPCELNDKSLKLPRCRNTWRQESQIQLHYQGCVSKKEFRPKYCSTCKRHQCCIPNLESTREIEFVCDNDRVVLHDFMWIKSCTCSDECP